MKKLLRTLGLLAWLVGAAALHAQPAAAPTVPATVPDANASVAPVQTPAAAQGATTKSGKPNPGVVTGLDVKAERARIAEERKQVEAKAAREQMACYQKFAVNDCLIESRASRRTQLADLKRQEIALNDAERKRKGEEQIQRTEQKQSVDTRQKETERREHNKMQSTARQQSGVRQPREAAVLKPPKPPHTPRTPRDPAAHRKDPAAAEVQADEERARYQRKIDEAAKHKAQTLTRNAERTKPKAKPLPPPPAS